MNPISQKTPGLSSSTRTKISPLGDSTDSYFRGADHTEYRALEAFGKSQQFIWPKYFQVKLDSGPSYSTIRKANLGID